MIEKTIYSYLSQALSVPVSMEVPTIPDQYADMPSRMVTFEKTRTTITNHVECATIVFQSYGTSMLDAIEIDAEMRDAVDAMPGSEDVTTKLQNSYNYSDTQSKRYRYRTTYDFYF